LIIFVAFATCKIVILAHLAMGVIAPFIYLLLIFSFAEEDVNYGDQKKRDSHLFGVCLYFKWLFSIYR